MPNETIESFRLVKKKAHFIEGIATKIIHQNSERISPVDQQFLSTSPWQIMTDDYEIKQKLLILKELFAKILPKDLVDSIIFHQSPKTFFYRNKMEYSLYYDTQKNKIELAVHARGSHQKIPISSSSLEMPEIFSHAKNLINDLNLKHEEARKYQSLILRSNQDGEISGGFYENYQPHPQFNNLTDQLLGKTYSYSPNGFFQINLPIYEQVLIKIKNYLKDSTKILDLYAGVGSIGLSVIEDQKLISVEVDRSAYQELQQNISNRLKSQPELDLTPILAKSEEILDFITQDCSVILDPPRSGCDKKLIEKLAEIKPEKIVYLSCNPVTQVRDLGLLFQKTSDYKVVDINAYNFFPQTPHIENLIFLTRTKT